MEYLIPAIISILTTFLTLFFTLRYYLIAEEVAVKNCRREIMKYLTEKVHSNNEADSFSTYNEIRSHVKIKKEHIFLMALINLRETEFIKIVRNELEHINESEICLRYTEDPIITYTDEGNAVSSPFG